MKKTISILMVAAIIGVGFTACNTEGGPIENEAPTVTIMEPSSANNPFMSGQSMHIHVEFRDDEELHDAIVSVTRQYDGTEVFYEYAHTHSKVAIVMVDTILTTPMHSDFVITAMASDHDGETTIVTETIHMHPM